MLNIVFLGMNLYKRFIPILYVKDCFTTTMLFATTNVSLNEAIIIPTDKTWMLYV